MESEIVSVYPPFIYSKLKNLTCNAQAVVYPYNEQLTMTIGLGAYGRFRSECVNVRLFSRNVFVELGPHCKLILAGHVLGWGANSILLAQIYKYNGKFF